MNLTITTPPLVEKTARSYPYLARHKTDSAEVLYVVVAKDLALRVNVSAKQWKNVQSMPESDLISLPNGPTITVPDNE
jgi:cupin superfamily acireductone dioxygenase involved in methionine salvage